MNCDESIDCYFSNLNEFMEPCFQIIKECNEYMNLIVENALAYIRNIQEILKSVIERIREIAKQFIKYIALISESIEMALSYIPVTAIESITSSDENNIDSNAPPTKSILDKLEIFVICITLHLSCMVVYFESAIISNWAYELFKFILKFIGVYI